MIKKGFTFTLITNGRSFPTTRLIDQLSKFDKTSILHDIYEISFFRVTLFCELGFGILSIIQKIRPLEDDYFLRYPLIEVL